MLVEKQKERAAFSNIGMYSEMLPTSGTTRAPTTKLAVSVGICAYNEEANIGKLLEALQSQNVSSIDIREIIVVSSGCTDRTNAIVESFQRDDPRIVLITEPERRGKASAVKMFLDQAKGEICVMESADTMPLEDAIEQLCLPFSDRRVGMVGGHPIPTNDASNFVGFAVQFVWRLQHKLSLIDTKLGDLIAFRNIMSMPEFSTSAESFAAADEDFIEWLMRSRGYVVSYAAEAYVRNKGPETVGGFLQQRRRNHLSHLHIRKLTGYAASTMNSLRLAKLALREVGFDKKSIVWVPTIMVLEVWARLLAAYDFYIRGESPHMWKQVTTTKDLS